MTDINAHPLGPQVEIAVLDILDRLLRSVEHRHGLAVADAVHLRVLGRFGSERSSLRVTEDWLDESGRVREGALYSWLRKAVHYEQWGFIAARADRVSEHLEETLPAPPHDRGGTGDPLGWADLEDLDVDYLHREEARILLAELRARSRDVRMTTKTRQIALAVWEGRLRGLTTANVAAALGIRACTARQYARRLLDPDTVGANFCGRLRWECDQARSRLAQGT